MSEQQPKPESNNFQVILFVVILSVVCALILSVLASALQEPKEVAKELDRSEQMMIAAKIFSHNGYFLIEKEKGSYEPAKFQDELLVPGTKDDIATRDEILTIYQNRLEPILVDAEGKETTFKEQGIDYNDYLTKYKKSGYDKQPYKLLYKILPNKKPSELKEAKAVGYVIPVNGFGLWDAIYGYIGVEPDGATVIGISWYEQKETPGLGANIADADWQSQFPGKKIFQPSSDGKIDYKTAPIGITVVKGNVKEVLGDSPKAESAVDGMAGATLTGNGVTSAYRDVLGEYRPFFIRLEKNEESPKS